MTIDVAPRPPSGEQYIGDGLYASFDGFQVKLRAPREHGDNVVYLEPGAMHEFWQFVLRTGCFPLHGEVPAE